MAEDIIATLPVECDSERCPVHWHLTHYWIYDDGTYSECDSDGNHDDIDEADVPTPGVIDGAWRKYWQYVAQTGDDPLREFTAVRRVIEGKARWQFQFAEHTDCLQLLAARDLNGVAPWMVPADLPTDVLEFAQVKLDEAGRPLDGAYTTLDVGDIQLNVEGRISCDWTRRVKRNPDQIRDDLRAAATRCLLANS